MRFIFALLLGSLVAHSAFAQQHPSDLVEGIKLPNNSEEGTAPVIVSVPALGEEDPGGFSELLPYIMRSPDQLEAGSCLYMSLNGIAEWWMARLHPELSRQPEGPLDFSARYLMNVAGFDEAQNGIKNWKTDSIYLFNKTGATALNSDYRFTKGWYTTDASGAKRKSYQGANGAAYGASYNWVDEMHDIGKIPTVALPRFKREILFADPESNQWNTGVMPANIVDKIKTALREKKAPVHIIYNHFGYWHATVIVGFNDELANNNCSFVNKFISYMKNQATSLRQQAAATNNPSEKTRLLKAADKAEATHAKTKNAYDNGGGCQPKGVFYVRDSIYKDPNGPMYDYDTTIKGDESPYVKKTILLEYDWVRYLANHATQISVE